jgi:1-acyl-sn-glycerol-3-phosphate acyltransferase
MKKILKKVHISLYMVSVAFFYFTLWPFFYYFSQKPKRFKSMNSLRRVWAITSSAFAGIFYKFRFEEPIDWSKTYIICPNHTSNLDASAMCVLLHSNCGFMGKQELEEGLVTRLFFRSVDIAVNRDSKMSAFRAFKKAAEKLKSGITLVIFPEGTISDQYPPELGVFKNGPFRLAIELKIPIIPVTSSNIWEILWDTGTQYGSKPGVCEFFVHKPIDTSHLTVNDADDLRDEVYGIMKSKFKAA